MPINPVRIRQIELEKVDEVNLESSIEQAIAIAKQYHTEELDSLVVTLPVCQTVISVRHDSNARLLFAHWYRAYVLGTTPKGPIDPYPAPVTAEMIADEMEMYLQRQA